MTGRAARAKVDVIELRDGTCQLVVARHGEGVTLVDLDVDEAVALARKLLDGGAP